MRGGRAYVEDEKGIFGSHDLRRAIARDLQCFFVPPLIPPFNPRDVMASPLEDENVLDQWALFKRRIDDGLGSNALSTSTTLIRCNDNTGLAVLNTITERFCRETCKDD